MKTVIEMAREAGFLFNKYGLLQGNDENEIDADAVLERFAELVRADECEQIAQMIEAAPPLVQLAQNEHGGCLMCGFTPKLAAAAIRARGGNT